MINGYFECEILRASRNRLLRLMDTPNPEILFKTPEGFNNIIIWQAGHCIARQQRHLYMRSGLPMQIFKAFKELFKIGSSPDSWTTTPDVNEVKYLLLDSVNHLETDLQAGLFINYEPLTLPIGFHITKPPPGITSRQLPPSRA
jgi:hypothetical protein